MTWALRAPSTLPNLAGVFCETVTAILVGSPLYLATMETELPWPSSRTAVSGTEVSAATGASFGQFCLATPTAASSPAVTFWGSSRTPARHVMSAALCSKRASR